ncbi:MAG: nuclear transport factor 2 family protein [Rhodobacteraceae bacterium]|nr:nuclear transport factor 2 family protein [Paracoccaceae bacterium]
MTLDDAGVIERAVRQVRERRAGEARAEQVARALPAAQPLPARRRTDHPRPCRPEPVPQGRSRWPYLSNILSALLGAGLMYAALEAVRSSPGRSVTIVAAERAAVSRRPVAPLERTGEAIASVPAPDLDSEARNAVENWRSAWSGRDIERYLASYSEDFVPPNGGSRDAWAEARRKNFARRSDIAVDVWGLTVDAESDDRLKVYFQQDYASGAYRETGQWKTLVLQREDGAWLIVSETQTGPGQSSGN